MLAALMVAWGIADWLDPLPPIAVDGARTVVARDGTPLRVYPSRDGVWRYPVLPSAVSAHYRQALLGYEDHWFDWHPGVNPVALGRAAWQWARAGRIVSGGSTLTMQVARLIDPSLSGPRSRSLSTKARQLWRALQLEARYDKEQILALYMTYAPMGGIVEGVEMGARMWLGKSSAHLSHAEAALLTALPQQPSRLRPDRKPCAAARARDKVMDRLVARGVWSVDQVNDARLEPVQAQPLAGRWLAPLAAERARQWLGAQTSVLASCVTSYRLSGSPACDFSNATTAGRAHPAIVHTTLDADIQSTVETLVVDRVSLLPPSVSAAALVMDNDSLEIVAYVGSADFNDAQRGAHVDMVRAVRSPGSTLKPFLYAQALDAGLIHSESMLLDAPLSFNGYAPGNFQAAFAGPVSVAQALQRSLNVPAVDLLDRVGSQTFAARLMAAGMLIQLPQGASPNLSLILGGGGTTLEALVGGYRSLARDGLAGRPRLDPTAPKIESRMMSAGAAWIVRDILEGGGHPDRPFTGVERNGQRLAWKTGTSFGFRDAWTLGVTDTWTIGVWIGRPDGTPNPGFFGASVAAPLVRDVSLALPERPGKWRAKPESVRSALTCWPQGRLWDSATASQCSESRSAWLLDETAPPTFAGYAPTHSALLRLRGVVNGAVLRPVPGASTIELTVDVQDAVGKVWWLVNGEVVGKASGGQSFTVSIVRNGLYTITAMDQNGRHDSADLEIAGVP
jgi:penicillin-binding protein 1C